MEGLCISRGSERKLRGSAQMISRYGSWSSGFTEAGEVLPPTVHAIICQTAVAHVVIGCISASILRTIRRLPSQTLQEKMARSLMISLAIGDVLHLFGTFYGIGDVRWKAEDWPQVLWLNIIVGLALFIPRYAGTTPNPRGGDSYHYRVCWLLGIGRFVATRDSRLNGKD